MAATTADRPRRRRRLIDRSFEIGPLVLAGGASMANSVVIAAAFGHLAGAAAFGTYQLALTVIGLIALVCISGSATAAMRAAARGEAAAYGLFRTRLPYCAAGAILAAAGGAVFVRSGNTSLGVALAAAGITLPAFIGADVYPAHLLGERRYGTYLRFQLTVQTLTAVGVVASLALAGESPWLAVLVYTGITGAVQLSGLLGLRHGGSARAEDLSYARRLTVVSILAAIDNRLDVLLAGALLGIRAAGLVAVARMFPNVAKAGWLVVAPAVFTRLASPDPATAAARAARYRLPIVGASGAICVIGIVTAPWILPLLGRDFGGAALVAQLLLAAVLVTVVAFPEHVLMRAQAHLRADGTVLAVQAFTSLIALPPLVFAFGVVGVGVEALVAAVVYVGTVLFLHRRLNYDRAGM